MREVRAGIWPSENRPGDGEPEQGRRGAGDRQALPGAHAEGRSDHAAFASSMEVKCYNVTSMIGKRASRDMNDSHAGEAAHCGWYPFSHTPPPFIEADPLMKPMR